MAEPASGACPNAYKTSERFSRSCSLLCGLWTRLSADCMRRTPDQDDADLTRSLDDDYREVLKVLQGARFRMAQK